MLDPSNQIIVAPRRLWSGDTVRPGVGLVFAGGNVGLVGVDEAEPAESSWWVATRMS